MLTATKAAAIVVLAGAACGGGDRGDTGDRAPAADPSLAEAIPTNAIPTAALDAARSRTFSDAVLDIAATYADGGGYAWPAPQGTHGTTRDLVLDGERIAAASGSGSHCVGLTFEVFWRALEAQPGGIAGRDLTAPRARELLTEWFVPTSRGRGPAAALPRLGLGIAIDELDDARPGDFVQMWFNSGRGHSAIFHGWLRDESGAITAIDFWSSQPWTDGIGRSTRAIGDGPRDVDRAAIYLARAALVATRSE